jgi:hypothetical protein
MSKSEDKLFNQVGEDAAQWMSRARDEIDALFGANHAKNNPHLVAMFMRVAAMNYQTIHHREAAAKQLDEFSRLIDSLNKFRTNDLPMLLSALQPEPKKPKK